MTTKNEVRGYDFRYNADAFSDADSLRELLKPIAKFYVFQLEEGATGYRHWQGRLRLIKKRRKHSALRLFPKGLAPQYFEPTVVTEFLTGEAFYQMKEDTRVDGPYTDRDPPPPVITKQMELFDKWGLLPWQETLKQQVSTFCLRSIDLVYDAVGNAGKSLFTEHMELKGHSEEVPPFRLMEDIFGWVASRPIAKTYIIDMPRGMKKDKLGDFYSGIEVIKNGVAYDKRYSAKKIRFDRPRVIVFTNTLPCLSLLSADRWNLWIINDKKLESYKPQCP
jgi:hypothetical protein